MLRKIAFLLILTSALTNNASANTCQNYDSRLKSYNGTKSKMLDLAKCNVNDSDIDDVIGYLNNHPIVDAINLSDNNLRAETADKLAALKYVSYLSINNNYLKDEGVHTILANKRIRELDVGNNQLTANSIQELAQQPHLIYLGLENSNLTDKQAASLAQSSIFDLRIGYNNISDEGAIALAQDKALRSLEICGNQVGEAGKKALTDAKIELVNGGTGKCGDFSK